MLIVNLHSTPSLEFWGLLTSAEATVEGLHSVCETGMFTLNICTRADGSLCLGIQAKDIYGCLMSSQCHNSNIPVVPWKKVDLCSSAGRSKSLRFLWDNAKQHVSHLQWARGAQSSVWHLFFLTALLLCVFPFVCCRYQLLPGRASRCAAHCTPALRASCATGRRRVSTLWLQWQRRRFRWVQNHGAADMAQCFHCHCTFVWLNTDAQLGKMAERFTHILESH